jgi:acetate kinase
MRAVAVGQIEGLGTAPRLKVKDGAGERIADEQWDKSEVAGHAQACSGSPDCCARAFQGSVLAGVGHRVVHGGPDYAAPLLVTPEAMRRLEDFIPLAPLHQPHNLAAIRAVQEVQPDLPQVACFDTAFHQTQERVAQFYGLPYEYFERGMRRYGFHGLSYEYIAAPCRRSRRRLPAGGWSSPTSAAVPACARCATAAASAARWGSPRSTAC